MIYADVFFTSQDGLRLYARDYAGPGPDAPVVLCLHGLTRNSKDFHLIASRLCDRARVIAPDVRGRGRSQHAIDLSTYRPDIYVDDILTLLALLRIPAVHVIGTSMGGLMGMKLLARSPDHVQSMVINDIGPRIEPAGVERIAGYVGHGTSAKSWADAAASIRRSNEAAFPDFSGADWLDMARNLHVQVDDRIELDYDPAISRGLADGTATPDLWPLFEGLAARPMLVLRGELSDLLSAHTVTRMQEISPSVQSCVIPRRGHAPNLEEPDAHTAIDVFLRAVL